MTLKLPKVIGHRGACAYAPENTLESIRTAADMGCKWVEFDVQVTRDGVPILMKDETLDRTTNGHGNVIDHSLADLNDLECGSWFGGSFGGIKIPTLEEAIDVLYEQNLGVTIDIQARNGRDVDTTEAILDVLAKSWDEPDRLLFTSNSIAALETCLEMAPEWHRNFQLGENLEHNWDDIARHLNVSTLSFDARHLTDQISDFLEFDKPLIACVINDAVQALDLLERGASSILSDAPDVILDALPRVH